MEAERKDEKTGRALVSTGYTVFFFSGICAISAGIVVSLLREMYGFGYTLTGQMIAVFNIGNMAACILTGLLEQKFGMKATALFFSAGYGLGYLACTLTGSVPLLFAAFLSAGLAKGCVISTATVLVGQNHRDRSMGLQLMHALYALGALLCPFLAAWSALASARAPMLVLSLCGLVLWLVFAFAALPGRKENGGAGDSGNGEGENGYAFLREGRFWLLAGLLFCQNAAEYSVNGWLVTYYREKGILQGIYSSYCITVMWGATLITRLLIAFVFPLKNRWKALAWMGAATAVLYVFLVCTKTPLSALAFLFLFACAIAGVNPAVTAGIGDAMSPKSVGILLPAGSIGGILMPQVIGICADALGLQAGMLINLIPCAGIAVLSLVMLARKNREA